MTDDAVRGKDSLDLAPWSLIAGAGHDPCAGGAFERGGGSLPHGSGVAPYQISEIERQHNRSSTSPVVSAQKVTADDPG